MKRQHFIALFLVLCFFLFLVPSTVIAGTKEGVTEDKKESKKEEPVKSDTKSEKKPEAKEESTDRKNLKKDEEPKEVKIPAETEEVKTEEPVVPEIKVDKPPRPAFNFRITNVQFDDGQAIKGLFDNSPDDWTDPSNPRDSERDIFKYDIVFERLENEKFIKHINRMLKLITRFKSEKEIFGDKYDVFIDFLNYIPTLKVKLVNLNNSRNIFTVEEIDEILAKIVELKIVLKQNKINKKFYSQSKTILNQLDIFETDLGEFFVTYSQIQKNFLKNIKQGRKLAKKFNCDRPEKVHNLLVLLGREIGLDSGNKDLNLIRSVPLLLDIQKKMETDDIETGLKKLDSMDLDKTITDLRKKLKDKNLSETDKTKLSNEFVYYETLRNQKELLFNAFRVYSMGEIIDTIGKFKPTLKDKFYRGLLKEYTIFSFDFLYVGDPRSHDPVLGRKLQALKIGKDIVGTRNFFKGQLSYQREGIRVLKRNIKEFKKIEPLFDGKYKEYKDKTFQELFFPYEVIEANKILFDALKSHIKVVSSKKIHNLDINLKTATINELETKAPIDTKPFITAIEKTNQKYNPFEGFNWKDKTFKEISARLSEEQKKKDIRDLKSFKKSIEKNYMIYGFLSWDVFSKVKVSEFGKHLKDTLKTTEDKHESYKIYIATLNETFKILKKYRVHATKLKAETLTIEEAQQPIRDCLKDLDDYLIKRYNIVSDVTPDTVYSTIITASRAFGDPDLDKKQALSELEKENYSKYQEKLKSALEKEGLIEEEKTAAQKQYDASLKLPEYRADLKKYINDKDLNSLFDYTQRFIMVQGYKPSFESDLVTLEKMKEKLTYENIVAMITLDYSLHLGYYSSAEIILVGSFGSFKQSGLGLDSYLVSMKTVDNSKQFSYTPVFGPYKGHPEWIKPPLFRLFFGVSCYIIIFLFFFNMAKSGKEIFVRPIAGLAAVDEAVGRATEMGRPVLYISGLSGIQDIATLASINILGQVARKIALYETPLIVPSYDPIVYTIQKEVVREAYIDVGKPDAFNEDSVFFLTQAQFAYAAGVNGIMVREKPATVFFMGMFFAESLIMAETGNSIGAIQIAGTDAVTQIPFFITACDYTLIGEELYAASAYMSKDPLLLGTLKAQDTGKLIIMILLAVGILLYTFGIWQEGFINFFENVPK
ncbi:hypothetical protein KAU33_07570 [Candidatus Dependentiae bacterium]|nr:hypothetical protein [Candidatus Dependentiae bacterium]